MEDIAKTLSSVLELCKHVGFSGALVIMLLIYCGWLIRYTLKRQEDTHKAEIERLVEEKRELQLECGVLRRVPTSNPQPPKPPEPSVQPRLKARKK